MSSKLEYLQRYMSGGGEDAADGDKKKKKKVKKTKKTKLAALGTRVVDEDDAWEQSAPSRENIEKKWELDAAEDEQPLVIAADGEEYADPQDLPVYVDSDKYLDKLKGREKQHKDAKDDDLSPPRKKATGRSKSGDDVFLKTDDASPPRRRPQKSSRRLIEESEGELSPPRRHRREKRCGTEEREEEDDATPLRSRGGDEDDASPPRRSRRDGSDLKRTKRSSPTRSSAACDRQRRVDSLGREIPPRSSDSQWRSRSASRDIETSSKRHDREKFRSRSRSRDRGRHRDRDRDISASPRRNRGRQSRSRSPRSRRRDSRSPSVRRRRSPRSSRWSSPQAKEPPRRRSRGRHRSASPRRSRSRSNSPRHRRPTALKKEGSSGDSDARRDLRTQSPSTVRYKTESRESAKRGSDEKDVKRGQKKASDDKEGKKAGLFTAAEFEHQRKIAAKRKDILRGVDASEMGANAETVYRDKRGRKLDMLNEMVRQQEILDGKRKREEREEYEWGTGEVQKRERMSQQELLEQMKKTPFARHEDDEELERKRRERVRAFDPMNSKVFQEEGKKKKKSKKNKKDKTTSKTKPKYSGPLAPPNRFGIQPGYRWDGVVRGTNWEEKIMMRQNANAAVSEEAYKYAVADM